MVQDKGGRIAVGYTVSSLSTCLAIGGHAASEAANAMDPEKMVAVGGGMEADRKPIPMMPKVVGRPAEKIEG